MKKPEIIFEDKYLIVIDKPAGLQTDKDVVNDLDSVESIFNFPVERGGIIHRIDKQTSGLLVLAKDQATFDDLKKQFKDHQVEKKYLALVYGKTPDQGEINTYLTRDKSRKQAMKAVLYPDGSERGEPRKAITFYTKNSDFFLKKNPLSLLEVTIKTGRTHQIRAHFKYLGFPLIGDQMYTNKPCKRISKILKIDRQFLHSCYLSFNHPHDKTKQVFTSDISEDLKNVLTMLQ